MFNVVHVGQYFGIDAYIHRCVHIVKQLIEQIDKYKIDGLAVNCWILMVKSANALIGNYYMFHTRSNNVYYSEPFFI